MLSYKLYLFHLKNADDEETSTTEDDVTPSRHSASLARREEVEEGAEVEKFPSECTGYFSTHALH